MGWIPDAHQAGFWVANADGLYRDVGLSVEILAGGTDTSAPRSVATAAADFGQISGSEQLVAARANGLPIVAVAAIHRESPHALVSLRKPIRQPTDLRGRRVAVAFGDAAEIHFKNLLRRNAIAADAVEMVPFRFNLQPLIDGEVDAVTGFSTDQPFTLAAQGYQATVLSYRDFGLRRYGYMIIARDGFDADVARRFISASRLGWERAFADPQHAVDVLAKHFGGNINSSAELAKIDALRPLMLQNGRLADWGVDPAVVETSQEDMLSYGQLRNRIDVSASIKTVSSR